MKAKSSRLKPGWRRAADGTLIKKLSSGHIIACDKLFFAYDSKGRLLGMSESQSVAERAAKSGVLLSIKPAKTRALRAAWNRAVYDGCTVIQLPSSRNQALQLTSGLVVVYLIADVTGSGTGGRFVRVMLEHEFMTKFHDPTSEAYGLTLADDPIIFE